MPARRYDHPEFVIERQCVMDRVGITSSALKFAMFRARAKYYVTKVIVGLRSVASIPGLVLTLYHGVSMQGVASAVAGSPTALSWLSATSLGSVHTFEANRTLNTGEFLAIGANDAKGKIYVEYIYQILPDAD